MTTDPSTSETPTQNSDPSPETTETTDQEAPEAETTPPEVDDVDDAQADDEPESGNAEAAKYRRRLRETEAERDQLRGQVETMRRAEAERLAGEWVMRGEAIWAAGTQLGDLLADDGSVDPEKVREATKAAQEALGLKPRPRTPKPNPEQGNSTDWSNARPQSLADAFRLR